MPHAIGIPAEQVAQRVRTRLMRRRVVRLAWRGLLICGSSLLIAALLVQTRDTLSVQRVIAIGERVAQVYQSELDAHQALLPALLAERVPADVAPHVESLLFNPLYPIQIRTRAEVGVCCSSARLAFYFRPAGRIVVTFDGRQFRSRLMTEAEFQSRREALGFDRDTR